MRRALIFSQLLMLVFGIANAQSVDSSHHVPLNKNLSAEWRSNLYTDSRQPYKGKDLYTIGMPCGGIGAGQLYVRGDGSLAKWWICNNAYNTGYGADSLTHFNTALGPDTVCYKTFRPDSYIDQGFAITVDHKTYPLNRDGFNDIAFIGEYPIAKITYNDTKRKLPVSISAEVYSPFIPLNARESATPATILSYVITNTSTVQVTATIDGWLQNLVCLDIAGDVNALSRNRIIKNPGMTSVFMDLIPGPPIPPAPKPVISMFDDFESGYGNWKITGTAFGTTPATGSFGGDQDKLQHMNGHGVVNSWLHGDTSKGKMTSREFTIPDDYILFLIGGGKHPGTTCFNLIVDKKVVCTATGRNTEGLDQGCWDVKQWKGKRAHFEIVDASAGDWGHINLDDIAFSDRAPVKEKYFPANHPYMGNLALSILTDQGYGNPAYHRESHAPGENPAPAETLTPIGTPIIGSVGTNITLAPGESKTVNFLLTWFFPNRPSYYFGSDVTDVIPNDWNTALPTDGATILGNKYANWFGNSMDVARYLQQNFQRLTTQTHAFHQAYYDNTTLPHWLADRLLMPLSILATETCQWWANDKFWAWEGVGSCVGTCTHVWNYEQALAHFFPELERNIRERTDFGTSFQNDGGILARNGWGGVLIDGHAGAILKAYREYLDSHDQLFLTRNWDYIKRATDYLIRQDDNNDGLIEKVQPNTFDIAFYGANTYVGALYLASLKAAAAMAGIMHDTVLQQHYDSIATAGSANTVKRLWNGEYFIQDVDLKKHPAYQYAKGCLSDQLFGQTWADLDHLGYVYPKEKVRDTWEAIWKYNWAPDVETQNRVHPPERTYADAGEPGLLVCTWPHSPHMGEKGVRYRDEVWTGSEYQVATGMIYAGMLEEGLSVVKGIDDRYSPAKHNPWNEIECGDHYARAMASWGVMLALEDYYYNGPEKTIGFAPKLNPGHFEGFFTTADAWGNISQERTKDQQQNKITLTYGNLSLTQLILTTPQIPATIIITHNKNNIPCTFTKDNEGKLHIQFEQIDANAGDTVSAILYYETPR